MVYAQRCQFLVANWLAFRLCIYKFRQQSNGSKLPGARKINTQLFLNNQWYDNNELNVLLMQWGQFIAHDITLLKPDISVDSYVMVKNKVRENRYYWECEKRVHRKNLEITENCTARATTDYVNVAHKLHSTPTEHNHAPEAPGQHIRPYLLSPEAVRKIIKRKRRKSLPAEPTTLEDINIPESLRNTFAGELFLLQCVQKGCFFHLAQNVWRKIQSCGLAIEYGTNEHFSLHLRYIPALTFLEPNEILASFNEIKQYIPIEIYSWFDETYVNGKIRRKFRNGKISRSPPLYPPEF
ncbi:hypothetical protein QTP88_009906 [Uroleucon formosanum]